MSEKLERSLDILMNYKSSPAPSPPDAKGYGGLANTLRTIAKALRAGKTYRGADGACENAADAIATLERERDEARAALMEACAPVAVSTEDQAIVETVQEWVNKRGGEETAEQIAAMTIHAYKRASGNRIAELEKALEEENGKRRLRPLRKAPPIVITED